MNSKAYFEYKTYTQKLVVEVGELKILYGVFLAKLV